MSVHAIVRLDLAGSRSDDWCSRHVGQRLLCGTGMMKYQRCSQTVAIGLCQRMRLLSTHQMARWCRSRMASVQ